MHQWVAYKLLELWTDRHYESVSPQLREHGGRPLLVHQAGPVKWCGEDPLPLRAAPPITLVSKERAAAAPGPE